MVRPVSIPPSSSNPYGVDGKWTAFRMQVGSKPTIVDALVSTSQAINYAVLTAACPTTQEDCPVSRGGLFSPFSSTSYDPVTANPDATFYIPSDGDLLGPNTLSTFGYDVVGLGDAGYTGYGKHLIGGVVNSQLWLGLMGIVPAPAALSGVPGSKPSNSILQDLKNQSIIPSLSWGYTGGASYQLDGVLGSLTLGGYDRNRFTANHVSFPMDRTQDYHNYLSVYVQSIKASTNRDSNREMLSEPIYAALDSTVSYLYLPLDVCAKFEDAFNLIWHNETQFYYISNQTRTNLLAQKPMPSVTFTLAPEMEGGDSVDIKFPYSAFDLMLLPPYVVSRDQYYFPIRRADNASAITLGRTFFQEAYVTADFERSNFSVSQAYFAVNPESHLVGIPTNENVTITHPQEDDSDSTSAGVIAGPVVAVVVIIVLAALGFWFWRRRKRRQRSAHPDDKELPAYSDHAAEMDGYGVMRRPEKTNTELEATESGRGTPVPNGHGGLAYHKPPGSSPLASPPTLTSPNLQNGPSEMDATGAYSSTYFELPGSAAQRRSMGPHEMNATADTPIDELSSNMNSGPLPDPPEPSPPIDTATTTSNPLTAGMETVPPPPPPKE